ncbi:MAG: hypothetical protein JSU01_02755 [Bacteroidetes bacterium]|nr:hypothetical protein [Bacteroidota bacterium]
MMLNYLISLRKNEADKKGTIHDPESKLKIRVFDALTSPFRPKKGEVQYFVTAGDQTLAFQTEGYKKHKTILILHMIACYCVYLGLIEAQIHASWPY